MSRTIGILQPGYLPWLGFFEQLYRSDIFVLYDDVQYDRGGWRNRNRIKTSHGVQWLTVPVRCRASDKMRVCDAVIDNGSGWRRKHSETIRQSYSGAPFFRNYWPIFEEAYDLQWDLLAELNLFFITRIAACLGLAHKEIVRSSSLEITGGRIERLISICRYFRADLFYEGAAGRNYIDDRQFAAGGIDVLYQDYRHPVYQQLYGEFIPYLSTIDLLFNHGEESGSILAVTG